MGGKVVFEPRITHLPSATQRARLSLTLPIYPITPSRPTFTPITPNDPKFASRRSTARSDDSKTSRQQRARPKIGAGLPLRAHGCHKTLVGGVPDGIRPVASGSVPCRQTAITLRPGSGQARITHLPPDTVAGRQRAHYPFTLSRYLPPLLPNPSLNETQDSSAVLHEPQPPTVMSHH